MRLKISILLVLLNLVSAYRATFANKAQYFYEIANQYFETLRYDSSEFYFAKAIPLLIEASENEAYADALNKYAASLWWQSKFFEAEISCRTNLETLIELLGYEHPLTADAMVNLGALGFASGNFGMSPEYFQQAIAIYNIHYSIENPKVATAYEWLGAWYESRADTINARKHLWKSYSLWKSIRGEDHPDLGSIYRYMGLYHKRFMNPDSALICFNKANQLFDQKYGPANHQSVRCLNNIAAIYTDNPRFEHLVIPLYEKCFALIRQIPSPILMVEVMTLFNKAAFFGQRGLYFEALENMNKVLELYYPEFNNRCVFSNPDLQNAETNHYVKLVLFYKSIYFRSLFDKTSPPELRYLDAMIDCFQLISIVNTQINNRLVNLDDILRNEANAAETYYTMITTGIEAYQISGNKAYLSTGLNFISHMPLIDMPGHKNGIENLMVRLSDSLILKRIARIESVNRLRTRLAQASSEENVERTRYLLHKEIIALDRLYFRHFNDSRISKPIGTKEETIKIEQIQSNMQSDETILLFLECKPLNKYFPQKLLTIAITDTKIKTEIIEDEHLFVTLAHFYDRIASHQTENISCISLQLYSLLLQPFEGMLQPNIIIIPSPALSRIPFNMLAIPSENPGISPKYLIQRHTVRQEFSLNSFYQNRKRASDIENPTVLAIAPSFNKDQKIQLAELTKRDTSLINLTGALIECNNISGFFRTDLLTGFEASKQHFLDTYRDYHIIHLSTHGVPLENEPEKMQLAFSGSQVQGNDHMMSFYEVLNLQLNTDLVVLSACKTGYGKINHGTGSLSLNWAFNRAGARSSVISLWDVNDYASALIMSAFYRNLSQGISKPEALRLAKLEYINTHDELMSDPYYWAGFVYYGPDEALVSHAKPNRTGFLMMLAGLAFAVVIALIYKRKTSGFLVR